jgi:L-glyceraldehyde 3-phosphate reductase
MRRVSALAEIARERGQTLAQLALAWALRDPRMTSLVMGASSVAQLEQNLGALEGPELTPDELKRIDEHAEDLGINWWQASSES